MSIHFDKSRMNQVLENHELWWKGSLNRPLVKGTICNVYPTSRKPIAPILSQATCADFSWSPEQIIDTLDLELSRHEYVGDGYPSIGFDSFGPGVLAAFCGAKLDNSSGRVWFFPCEEDISKLHVQYNPENIWSRRIKDIYRAGLERWNGSVIMSFPDLGGVMDVLASLCGTENLLYALIDEPEEVHRLIGEIETVWYAAYQDLADVLKPQGAYTDWNGILSKEPSYITQCDFSYMISPAMFQEFVLETLRKDTEKLTNVIYHLDGIGQLNHLDMILSIKDLKAIQWVYGTGQPGSLHWMDVYKKIVDAGKQIMIIDNGIDNGFLEISKHLGCNPYTHLTVDAAQRHLAMQMIR